MPIVILKLHNIVSLSKLEINKKQQIFKKKKKID